MTDNGSGNGSLRLKTGLAEMLKGGVSPGRRAGGGPASMRVMRDFPDSLRAHFETPHRIGEPPGGADLSGEARNPACGDHLVIYLKLGDGRVSAAGFRAQGCPAVLATGSAACSLLEGLPADSALPDLLGSRFGNRYGAPQPAHRHALSLCVEALRQALRADVGSRR